MIPLFRSFPTSCASSSAHFVCHVWHVSVFARVVNFMCFRLPVRSTLSVWTRSSATQVVFAQMFDAFVPSTPVRQLASFAIAGINLMWACFVFVCKRHFHRLGVVRRCPFFWRHISLELPFQRRSVALDSLSIIQAVLVQMSSIDVSVIAFSSDFVHVCESHFHRVQCNWECPVDASNSDGSGGLCSDVRH